MNQETAGKRDSLSREQFAIGGMQCSFCTTTLTKGLKKIDGVSDVYVNLGHGEAMVDFDPFVTHKETIEDTIKKLGYTVRDRERTERFRQEEEELQRSKNIFWESALATIAGLVTLLLFKFYSPYAPYLYAPAAVIAAANVFVVGHNVLRMAGSSLRRGILNQHVLMELAALAAFSAGITSPLTGFSSVPFFSIATFITTYHLLGAYLTTITRERSTKAIFKLLSLSPEKAHVITDQGEKEIPTKEVRVGDIVLVKPGESVPVDGEVVEGISEVDESMVTGESMPVGKLTGSSVIGGSSNINGVLTIRAKVVGEDSFLSKVAGQIEEARVMKPGIMQLIDVILKYFAPAVVVASVLGFVIWLLIPYFLYGVITFTLAIYAAISALVMGYPCALGMSTPLALERGQIMASEDGFIFRSADSFMNLKNIDTVVFDKTGTITEGLPNVLEVLSPVIGKDHFLTILYSLESNSNHPLSKAIVTFAEENGQDHSLQVSDFHEIAGRGVEGYIDGKKYYVGGFPTITGKNMPMEVETVISKSENSTGKQIFLSDDHDVIGMVMISDKIRGEATYVVESLRKMGKDVIMLTGDDKANAKLVADKAHFTEYHFEKKPDEKVKVIRELQASGRKVLMVGDGINDAPSLTQADVSIAVTGGTDVAKESADIVVFRNSLEPVMNAISIGSSSYRKSKENLAIAVGTNSIGLILAVAGIITPIYAMIAMVTSASIVLANSFIRKDSKRILNAGIARE